MEETAGKVAASENARAITEEIALAVRSKNLFAMPVVLLQFSMNFERVSSGKTRRLRSVFAESALWATRACPYGSGSVSG
jgi:hypothetical protein